MPALTSDRLTPQRDGRAGSFPVKANTIIYSGALVAIETSSGFAVPASNISGLVIVGVAASRADNSAGGNGTISVTVEWGRAFKFNAQGAINNTHIGRVVYAVDDNTVTLTPNNTKVGKVVGVDPDGVWVYIPLPGATAAPANLTIDNTYDSNEASVLTNYRDNARNYSL